MTIKKLPIKKLPVFANKPCSEEFRVSFSAYGTSTAITCVCGRTHFYSEMSNETEDEELQLQALRANAEENSDKYVEHGEDDIGYFDIEKGHVVFNCDCHGDRFMEDVINIHMHAILSYLNVTSEKKLEEAKEERSEVVKVKSKVDKVND